MNENDRLSFLAPLGISDRQPGRQRFFLPPVVKMTAIIFERASREKEQSFPLIGPGRVPGPGQQWIHKQAGKHFAR